MKKILNLRVFVLLFLVTAPMASQATVFFADYFTNSSTVNQPFTEPTTNSTSYQTYIGLAGGTNGLTSGAMEVTFPINSGVLGEFMGMFTNSSSPLPLTIPGDYMSLSIVFVNSSNILGGADTANASINVGLFNSVGVAPNQGNIVLSAGTTTGGTQNWLGYWGRFLLTGGTATVRTRPAQTPSGTSSQNQDLLFSNASGSQSFNAPAGTEIGSGTASMGATLTNGATYTIHLVISITSSNSLVISNALYAGTGTATTPIASQIKVTGTSPLTSAFNGFALGWRNTSVSQGSSMSVRYVEVTGQSTAVTSPPDINQQPVDVKVAPTGSCAFFVTATGYGMQYQWHRFGTNLVDGGNISGANSDLLAISPAGAGDVASGNNGYWVTITGVGNYSTNSTTNALSLRTATNLTWNASAPGTWDLNNTANWQNPASSPTVFNFGDPVTFDDTSSFKQVNLSGRYLGAASVTVDASSSSFYNWVNSSGSFAGNGQLIYKGAGGLQIGNVNTYTGGTIISNTAAHLYLQNYGGLGTGPVTLAKAGGVMEIFPVGSATTGLNADLVVQDDFTIQVDAMGTFSAVFFGNVSGTAGKLLTLNPNPSNTTTNQRVRIYGNNTTYNADLLLNSTLIFLAPYLPNGTQTYNGVISGDGALIQRGNGTTILNGQNTYTGGTIPTTGTIGLGVDSVGGVTSGPLGTGALLVEPEVANATGNGTILAVGGARSIANPLVYRSGTNNQTLIIGGSNAVTFSGTIALNGTDGATTFTNRIFQVGNTALTTFSGVISGTGFGLVKSGAGVLALENTETYTGPTTVSNGTLRVNGQLDAGAVFVNGGATLGGTGTIPGPVTVASNGTVSAGASIGTLTINNNLSLGGNVFVEVNKSSNPSNDLTSVSGTLTNTGIGTVTVTNLGSALVVGDSFKIFNKAVQNGATLKIAGGGTGIGWNNDLAVDGSISVAAVLTGAPLITSVSVGGGNISLSGTNGAFKATYYILASTNVTAPLATWTRVYTNVFGPGGSFLASVPVSSSQPTRFYLLAVP